MDLAQSEGAALRGPRPKLVNDREAFCDPVGVDDDAELAAAGDISGDTQPAE